MLAIRRELVKVIIKNFGQFAINMSWEDGPLYRGSKRGLAAKSCRILYQGRLLTEEQFLDLPTFLRRGKSITNIHLGDTNAFQEPMGHGNGAAGADQ